MQNENIEYKLKPLDIKPCFVLQTFLLSSNLFLCFFSGPSTLLHIYLSKWYFCLLYTCRQVKKNKAKPNKFFCWILLLSFGWSLLLFHQLFFVCLFSIKVFSNFLELVLNKKFYNALSMTTYSPLLNESPFFYCTQDFGPSGEEYYKAILSLLIWIL